MAAWSSSYITALPDSAFACIDSKGRHYPHHDASGKIDLPHLRNALSRLGQDDTTSCGASHLRAHARAEGIGKATTVDYLKAEQLSTAKWRVLAIPFGGPFKGGKDADGEYFSARTDIKKDWFRERPVLWHHGGDEVLKDESLGTEDDLELERDGWWGKLWLDRSNRYWEQVNALLAAGKVYGSSGALGHLVQKARDGEILVWPHIEQTLTPTPANPFARVVPTKAVDHFTSAGIAVEPLEGFLAVPGDAEADLPPDLPSGGDAEAIQRLMDQVSRLTELVRALKR